MTAEGAPIRLALAAAAARIDSATPRLDAELLMAHALGISREALLLARLDDPAPAGFAPLLARRLRHEPIAYITGTRGFWTIELAVGPGVLVPRADSETLIEAAVAHFAGTPGPRRILDLGTGSGALLLAALDEWPEASGVGIDRSAPALAIAADNARRLGMADRATMRAGGWDGTGERFDLILCNPPYIEDDAPLPDEVAGHEPASALFAGADGLDDYRRIALLLAGQLAPGGIAVVEVGAGQALAVTALLDAAGFATANRRDLGGHERCIIVQVPE
ncbi:peptide chain release factor N(5)-glutamine methyltransferase [Sphingomonas solaris]|uniref:Release factor glutamine methyltransferase n=1 Tax=Alterirhizorhabdus solaris TaxID=2529389 RepID=A0A558QYV2_9SPHN|nr:peptide chain release factor N(5)-glutamine methyltransferase [Sphingomonas solaris]TVV72289.1 peptide chain release factor N(5)-glutamine methyltransferase [Sphingomonas solaris]